MTTDPHECARLGHELPAFRGRIGPLHAGDAHCARPVDRHRAVGRERYGA